MFPEHQQAGSCHFNVIEKWRGEAECFLCCVKKRRIWRHGSNKEQADMGDLNCQMGFCDATEGHRWVHSPTTSGLFVDVHGYCYHQRSFGCPWSGTPPEVMLMAEGHCSCWKHTNLSSLCYHLRLCWPLGQAATEGQVWIHGPIVARLYVDALSPCFYQRSCGYQGYGPCWFPEPNCHCEHTALSGLHCQPGTWWYSGPK